MFQTRQCLVERLRLFQHELFEMKSIVFIFVDQPAMFERAADGQQKLVQFDRLQKELGPGPLGHAEIQDAYIWTKGPQARSCVKGIGPAENVEAATRQEFADARHNFGFIIDNQDVSRGPTVRMRHSAGFYSKSRSRKNGINAC